MSHAAKEPIQDLAPGMRLDRYEIVCKISHGGMASVWVARLTGSHGFERLFALKTILPDLAADQQMRSMFLDEANIASRIEHPNVARVFELGEAGGILFQVMEWVDGESLSYLARTHKNEKRAFPLGIALRICADACLGLHAAHEQKDSDGNPRGVVHRDVSPQNILVSRDGIVKVIDFGIAKALDRVSEETRTGLLKGKLKYMAPEQALKKGVDRRADVFSMGAVLYSLLRGASPHGDADSVHILTAMLQGNGPEPLAGNEPEAARAVVSKAMAFDAANRYASCAEMAQALENAMLTCGCPTTAAEVSEFVKQYAGERLVERSASIRSGLDSLSQGSKARLKASASGAHSLPDTAAGIGLGEPPAPKKAVPLGLIVALAASGIGLTILITTLAVRPGTSAAAPSASSGAATVVPGSATATPSVAAPPPSVTPNGSAAPSAVTAGGVKLVKPPGTRTATAATAATAATPPPATTSPMHMKLE